MSQKLKVVTIGGGSSYTPELLEGFMKRYHELPVTNCGWLMSKKGRRNSILSMRCASAWWKKPAFR
jgi:alpha-galactosidase/6-phospho-beta-glucosidase family protein